MRKLSHFAAAGVLAVVLSATMSAPGLVGKAWSQAFGMIAATVEKADDARGLTIRSEPSESAKVVGYLPVGAEIRACNDFRGNWARLQSPSPGGWVNMVNLKPQGGEGSVVAVEGSSECLPIRKGPGNSYERVGCARLGEKLKLSGVWSENNFAKLESGDWVDASKISTDLMTCDASALPQAAEESPPDYQEPSPTHAPSYDGSYTYAPSYNFGTFGEPYLFGPYCGFGFYPGWWSGVSAAIWNAYPWRYWRHPYYHHPHPIHYAHNRTDPWRYGRGRDNHNRHSVPYAHSRSDRWGYWRGQNNHNRHPVQYTHNRANVNPNRSTAAVNHRAINANRAIVNTNRPTVNNFRAPNVGSMTNYRSSNAAWNRGHSNSSVRSGSFSRGFTAPRSTATASRGNSVRAGNFASSGFRGSSSQSGRVFGGNSPAAGKKR